MTESNQLTWEKLRRFFEVDNFGMPLPDWYGELFDEFREAELRKAKAEGVRLAAEHYKATQGAGIRSMTQRHLLAFADTLDSDDPCICVNTPMGRADQIEAGDT